MKKAIPVIIAIVLIGVVVALNFGNALYAKYSYGTERADLNEYFDKYYEDSVPIILQDEKIADFAKIIEGELYLEKEVVENYLTMDFYFDYNENLFLFTTDKETVRSEIGSDTYTEGGELKTFECPITVVKEDEMYISMKYIKKFVNYSYELFSDPDHIQMYTEWGEKKVATINDDTAVRWKGGVKSVILTDAVKGDEVEILEPMDEWTKVKTKDAYIGYVENKKLSDERIVEETPVTDVEWNYTSLTKEGKINMAWHNIEYPMDGYGLIADCAKIKSVNVISPTSFWLTDNEGNFKSVLTESYVEAAHRMGADVWVLVSNFHYGDDVDLEEVLSYTQKRAYLIQNLVTETVAKGADGINVDFENVSSSCGPHYVQFIKELSLACHENNLVISVDNYVPTEYTRHYRRSAQAKFADYLVIMGYDEHYAGSDVGSVGSIPWVKLGIEDTMTVCPAEKIILGIPFYTRVWMTTGNAVTSEAVDMATSNEFLAKHSLVPALDEATGQNYAEIAFGGTLYQVWMEDEYSIKERLNLIDSTGIAGVAEWKLGMETDEVWDYIESYMLK